MSELEIAIGVANTVLDRPHCDPDGELETISRQLIRQSSANDDLRTKLAAAEAELLEAKNDIVALERDLKTARHFQALWAKKFNEAEAELSALREELSVINVLKRYDERLKTHPHFKKFIEHTPFENDCATIAWDVVRQAIDQARKA